MEKRAGSQRSQPILSDARAYIQVRKAWEGRSVVTSLLHEEVAVFTLMYGDVWNKPLSLKLPTLENALTTVEC